MVDAPQDAPPTSSTALVVRTEPDQTVAQQSEEEDATNIPLIDRIRAQNIKRNDEFFAQLNIPTLTPRPAPRPRRASGAATRVPPSSRGPSRSRANATTDVLKDVKLGFDFGFGEALMAFQLLELQDLLVGSFGEENLDRLLEQCCRAGGSQSSSGSAAAASSATNASVNDESRPLTIVLFARVGFQAVGAAVVKFHHWASIGGQLAEIVLFALPSDNTGKPIGRALMAYICHLVNVVRAEGNQVLLTAWQPVDANEGTDVSSSLTAGPEWDSFDVSFFDPSDDVRLAAPAHAP